MLFRSVTTLAGIYRLKSGGVGSSDPDTDGGVNWELIPTQAKVDAKAAISGQAFTGNISAPNLSGTNTGDQTLSEIGVGQTWQDVSGSRVQNTNYTNSTGKPIMVSIRTDTGTLDVDALLVDGVGVGSESANALASNQFIVPNGSVYRINSSGILAWSELR